MELKELVAYKDLDELLEDYQLSEDDIYCYSCIDEFCEELLSAFEVDERLIELIDFEKMFKQLKNDCWDVELLENGEVIKF